MSADDSLPGVDAREEERRARASAWAVGLEAALKREVTVSARASVRRDFLEAWVALNPPAPLVDRDTGDEA